MSILTTYLIHWGMGRFCFIFFASFCLMRKVLRADIIWNDGNVHLTLLHHSFYNVNRFKRSCLMSYSDRFDSEDIHIRVAHVLFWIYPVLCRNPNIQRSSSLIISNFALRRDIVWVDNRYIYNYIDKIHRWTRWSKTLLRIRTNPTTPDAWKHWDSQCK